MMDLARRKMNNKDMAMVAGGTVVETAWDYEFLCDVNDPGHNHSMSCGWVKKHWDNASDFIAYRWNRYGVTCIPDQSGHNQYFIGGKQVDRWTAIDYVGDKYGGNRIYDPEDYGAE